MNGAGAHRLLLLSGLLLCLAFVNASIVAKERLMSQGRLVYLELAPVDPRSLMQGDYMALNYRVAEQVRRALPKDQQRPAWLPALAPGKGRVVIRLDDRRVGQFVRLDDGRDPAADEFVLQYRIRAGKLRFASDAWFFEEGTAARYEQARYGRFRVADDGEMLLTGLSDARLQPLGGS
ncbi:MAG: GDYXXLXY domain-containing protein [Xanthomonadales bacterium]|nr:GDYXXLXY domain-containing protein [Xanthomonadales bacterium]